MKRFTISAMVLALAVSGCDRLPGFLSGGSAAPAAGMAAASLSEPAPGQPPAPRRATDWRDLRRDIPYVNMTAGPLPVYEDAERSALAGSLPPGEGGYIESCSDTRPLCEIRYRTDGTTGWVPMDRMGGITN